MKKKLFLFLLSLFSLAISADEGGSCGENLTWSYIDATHTLTISGSGPMENFYIDGPWYSQHNNIQKIVIEEGVTTISNCAFMGCENLISVSIPKTVTTIGSQAFFNVQV